MNIGDIIVFLLHNTLGTLLYFCYNITNDYGVALIIFTLITRIILFPLAIKQQRSTAEMVRMRPKLDQIQKKFSKDKAKLNEANMKLYQEEGYNPLGGCLPMLIQLPIVIGLYTVVNQPLTYILGLSHTQISKVVEILKPYMIGFDKNRPEIYAAQYMAQHVDKLSSIISVKDASMRFDFLNFNLSQIPGMPGSANFKLSVLLLIPILCYVTQFLSSWLSIRMTSAANPQTAKGMNTSMIVFMPLITAYISFTVPASLGFYWVLTNIFMVIQVLILNKFYHPMKLAAISEQKSDLKKQSKLAGQISEIDNELVPDLTAQNHTDISVEANKPKNVQQRSKIPITNNQKKKNKYNNKKRLAAARELEMRNLSDKD